MRNIVFLLITIVIFPIHTFAKAGDWSGSGGNGYAFLFTNLAYRIHRELLMEEYRPDALQARDEMNLGEFLKVIYGTKVITTYDNVIDKHGNPQTANYYNRLELRILYAKEGLSEDEIELIMKDLPFGLIVANVQLFKDELNSKFGIALATVFHEYRRVLEYNNLLKLSEKNYQSSASLYDIEFFSRLADQSTPVSKIVYAGAVKSLNQPALGKIELIDEEKLRLEGEIDEDFIALNEKTISRRPFVIEQRKLYQNMFNAYATVLDSLSFVPSPFPSAFSDTMSALGGVAAESVSMRQKMSEIEVINLQISYLRMNLKRNMDFYERIDIIRNNLFLSIIEENE